MRRAVVIREAKDASGTLSLNDYLGKDSSQIVEMTVENGTFSLKGLPPGTYTIEAWHEKLGTQTQMVTIGAKETKDVPFTFKGA